ncbi:hypothetical protein RUND412_006533 [Rhizina undulata]
MTPALKRGSRSRPLSAALEDTGERRSGKRTRSTNSSPVTSTVLPASASSRPRSNSRSTVRKVLNCNVDGTTDDGERLAPTNRMAPDTAVSSGAEIITVGKSNNLTSPSTPSPTTTTIIQALSSATKKLTVHPTSDQESESSLSDLGEDSEAETERLHNSPQKQRTKVMVQHTGNSSSATRTISLEASVGKEPTKETELPVGDVPPESKPATPSSSPNKKRKRDDNSPANSHIEFSKSKPVTPPPKKKLHSTHTDENGANPDKKTKANGDSDKVSTTNGDHRETKPANATNGKDDGLIKSKVITEKSDDTDSTAEHAEHDLDGVPETEMEEEHIDVHIIPPPEDDTADVADAIREDDEDAERALRKKKAMDDLTEIERVFAQLKDRIYSEKLKRAEIEMKMIQDGTHPECIAQKACIDQRLEEKIKLANAQYKHAMESLDIATRVTRAQQHSQYFQRARALREEKLSACSELWYNIQRERRAGDTLVPEYSYRMPDRGSTRIKHRQQYNWEVALLTGISKYVGFPAAPDVVGASEEEKVNDLEAMGIAPRAPVRASAAAPPVTRDRLLDEPYERPSALHWPQPHHSPPSPVPHTGPQAHPHAPLHHHHRRHHHTHPVVPGLTQHQQEAPASFAPRRVPPTSTAPAGSAHQSLPLSSLLQNSEIKMEQPTPRQPSAIPSLGHPFNGGSQQQNNIHNHQQPHSQPTSSSSSRRQQYQSHSVGHSHQPQGLGIFGRGEHGPTTQPPQRIIDVGRSPTPGERGLYTGLMGRESTPDGGLRRLKEESDGLGMGPTTLGMPLRYGPRMGYS